MLYKVPNSCEGARQKLFLGSCRGAKYSSGAAVVAIRQSITRNTTTRLSTYSNYRRPGIASPVLLLLSRVDEMVRVSTSIAVGEEKAHKGAALSRRVRLGVSVGGAVELADYLSDPR